MNKIKVRNMESPRSYRSVANQFIIDTDEGRYFQSYSTIIAFVKGDKVVLDENKWNYSVTTAKYRNQFLRLTTKETQAKIDSGEYELADLN